MSLIKDFYSRHREVIRYFFFGIITTVVSLGVCYLTLKFGVIFFHDEKGEPTEFLDILGSILQWVSGVFVSFFTNKKWVFTSAEKGFRPSLIQFEKFAGSRIATLFLEIFINLAVIFIFDLTHYVAPVVNLVFFTVELSSRLWAKIISSVVVVVSNYFISKLLVFRNR